MSMWHMFQGATEDKDPLVQSTGTTYCINAIHCEQWPTVEEDPLGAVCYSEAHRL